MHETELTYERLGVSSHKRDVHDAISDLDQGLFPGAFCKAIPDVLSGSLDHCLLVHADGAGTKSTVAYLHYLQHRNPSIFAGIAQDSAVMNLDDLLCVGATGPFAVANTIGRNKKLIPGEVVRAIIHGYEEFFARMEPYGVRLYSCGGETADLGDLVQTLMVDSTFTTRMRRDEFINCANAMPGHALVGLASFGHASYETAPNSGIGTNGFTAARHRLLSRVYRRYAETYAPQIADDAYTGQHTLDTPLPGTPMSLGEALLSPTRTYAPILVAILRTYRPGISAVFHNSGGGLTKCLNFAQRVTYIKDDLFPPPPIFDFLRTEGSFTWSEMVQTFNMGHRLEIACDPAISNDIIALAREYNVDGRVIGRIVPRERGPALIITCANERLEFTAPN